MAADVEWDKYLSVTACGIARKKFRINGDKLLDVQVYASGMHYIDI